MRYFFLILILGGVSVLALAGFRGGKFSAPPIEIFPDMDRQAKVKPQSESVFFADGRSARPPIAETIPVGYNRPVKSTAPGAEPFYKGFSQGDDYLNTGKMGANWGTGLPVEVNEALLVRGQQRYSISCAVCHGATGAGNGITTQYGLVGVPSYHQARLRDMADGEIYNTIVHGKNTMMPYGDKLTVPDRWAIVAYVRALQRSQNATLADVPPEKQKELEAK